MIFFHVTETKNLSSIKEVGLIPAYTQGLTSRPRVKYLHENHFRRTSVWLTDDPYHVVRTQASPSLTYAYLGVDCSNLKLEPYVRFDGEVIAHEFLHKGIIIPERILTTIELEIA